MDVYELRMLLIWIAVGLAIVSASFIASIVYCVYVFIKGRIANHGSAHV